MKAENLVNKEELCDWLNAFVFEQKPEGDMISIEDVERGIKKCTLSPAELADKNLTVLVRWKILKESIQEWVRTMKEEQVADPDQLSNPLGDDILKLISDLESQSSIEQVEIEETEEERQKADELMREDIKIRRRAEAWVTLSGIRAEIKDKEPFVKEIKKTMQAIWNLQGELLAESDLQDYL